MDTILRKRRKKTFSLRNLPYFTMNHRRLVELFILLLLSIAKCTAGQKASPPNQQYFRIKPQDVNAIEKETITLNCEIGNLGGLVQWSKDGFLLGYESQIPGYSRYTMLRDLARGSFNLQIKRSQLEDEGDFQCQVGPSENNQPIRAGAIVSVSVPPQELLLTSSSSICLPFKNLNTELNLSDPSAMLTSLNISQQLSSFNSSTQYAHYVQLLNQLMTNTNDQNKLNKKLSKYRPSLPFVQLREAERLTLICNTSTPTKPETRLLWLKNGVPIKEDQYNVYVKSGLGNSGRLTSTRASLTVFIKATEEGVIYTCVALHPTQKEPKLMLSVRVSVLSPPGLPKIEGYKEDEPITSGDTLTLACICKAGNPPAHLKWLRDEQILIANSQTIVRQQKKQIKQSTKDADELIDQSDDLWIDLGEEETIEFAKLTANRQSDVSRTLSIQVKPEDHYTTYSCQAINQLMFAHHFRSNIASVRLNIQYPPSTIQLVGDPNALISQANTLLKFSCAVGPSNPAVSQVKLMIDGRPLDINSKQTEMHYSTDHNSIRTSNSLNLEHLLVTFNRLNRKLNGFVYVANSSTSLNRIFLDKHKPSVQRKRHVKVVCSATHPLLASPLTTEYDLQLLYPPSTPVLKIEPNNAQFAGEYKRFTCSSHGGNPPPKLKFFEQQEGKANRIALQSTTSNLASNQNSISTLELLLTPNENGATIFCEVESPALLAPSYAQKQIEVYFVSEQLHLATEASPARSFTATTNNSNDEWKINDEFALVCRAGPCNPACNLDWLLNGNKLGSGTTKRFRIANEQSVSTNGGIITLSRLNVNSIQIADHGQKIECIQSNALFNQTTKRNYILQVLHPPVFDLKNNLKHFDIWEKETLHIEFIAKGHPNTINYEFYFGPIRLSSSQFFQIQGPKITFKHVALSLGGDYEVHAINNQGRASHQFNINVLYSPKLISATTLLYLDRNMNQTVKINCSVAANPIKQVNSEWQKLILFEKFITQNNDAKLDSNDVMYSENEEQYPFESEDENEFMKEKLAYSYLWFSPNLEWWWSSAAYAGSANHIFASTANSLSAEEYKPFAVLNSSLHYNQKVISRSNQMLIITNDTFTIKSNQQKHHLATATLPIEPPFLNDTDYLCVIQSNPASTSSTTDAETPNIANFNSRQSSVVTRIAIRQKRRPLLLNCNSLEIPALLANLKEQVVDYWYGTRSQVQVYQAQNKRTININNNRKSISVAAEPGDTVSFYCTAARGALMVQFSWRDVKHGQLLGAISHTFLQPSIELNWRRSLNATASQAFPNNVNGNSLLPITTHQQFLNQQSPITKSDLNTKTNYTVRLHFNPQLPELITTELKLSTVSLDHFSTQFQCLVSNELGSDSATYEIRRKSVPDHVEQVHAKHLNNNRLLLKWMPGFDGGFNQQYIVRFALKNEFERAIQSKQSLATTAMTADLQHHPNSVQSRESLNEIRQANADENEILLVEEQEQNEERMNKENLKANYNSKEPDINKFSRPASSSSSSAPAIQWRTEQDSKRTTVHYSPNNQKRKNMKKRINIKWNGYLLSPNGPFAQLGSERLVSNETQIEFTDLKPASEYYFTILSKNRLGLAREHSVPLLIRTPKADQESSSTSDQVQSNLQLGENSLGLIEYGLLTNPTANLTIWLLIVSVFVVVLVNAAIFSVVYFRKRAAKLSGSLTSADTVTTACTNSTQCTTLSQHSSKDHSSSPSACEENQLEANEKQTIQNENIHKRPTLVLRTGLNNEIESTQKTTVANEHCIMNATNSDVLLSNGNVTFTLMPSANPISATNCSTLTKSNQSDYLSKLAQSSTVNNQSAANLVYAQLRPDNSITSNLIHSTNHLLQSGNNSLIQAKTIVNNYNYATTAAISPSIVHQLDNGMLSGGLDACYDLSSSYSNMANSNEKSTSKSGLQTRINKLSTDYKEKYIPYYLNESLLSFEPELGWNGSNMITDFYSSANASSSLSGKLASSSSLLASCTPSPSTTITYSSQLPHLITSSSLTTSNTLSPLDHLTPSTAYSYRTLNSNPVDFLPEDDASQLKLSSDHNYDQFISAAYSPAQQSPLLVQTLVKNHANNNNSHFLTSDFHPQDNYGHTQSYTSLQHHSKAKIKKTSNKTNHCKVVSFQKPVECWMLDNEKDTYYKQ